MLENETVERDNDQVELGKQHTDIITNIYNAARYNKWYIHSSHHLPSDTEKGGLTG